MVTKAKIHISYFSTKFSKLSVIFNILILQKKDFSLNTMYVFHFTLHCDDVFFSNGMIMFNRGLQYVLLQQTYCDIFCQICVKYCHINVVHPLTGFYKNKGNKILYRKDLLVLNKST